MKALVQSEVSAFEQRYNGLLYSVMQWEQLTRFWASINAGAGWYIYAVGQDLPTTPSSAEKVRQFTSEIDALLRREHHEDYCAIVYADDLETPSFIKIYDPNHLGSSCGSSATKSSVLPGWIMCQVPPIELKVNGFVTGQRKRWWQSFLGSHA